MAGFRELPARPLVNAGLCLRGQERLHPRWSLRGLGHVVVAWFGPRCVFILDMLRRSILGAVAEEVVCDPLFWNDILLPIAVGVLGATVGLVPVHCACLSSEGEGLIIASISAPVNSRYRRRWHNPALTIYRTIGFYFSQQSECLTAHGMAARLKPLPDALSHFPNLSRQSILDHQRRTGISGDAGIFGAPRSSAVYHGRIFLERIASLAAN